MRLKLLRFLPLAFLAGTHGFAIFAPYVAVVLTALHLRSRHRAAARRVRVRRPVAGPAGVPIAATPLPA